MKKNLPSSRLSSGSTLVVALLLLSNLLTANSSLFPFGNFDGKDNSERVFEEYVQAYQPLVVAPEWLFRDTELPPARATDQLMMAGVMITYANSTGGTLVKQDVTACDGMSLNQARFIVTDNLADNMTVTLDLPPGIFYEPGSISVVTTSGGLTVSESNITDRNMPVFAISPANLAAGNSVTLQWDRRNDMTCDAYNSAIAGGIFKDSISVSTNLGITADVDPTVNTYNLLFASLSLAGAAPVTTTVGSTVNRTVTVTNGGLGFLGGYSFTIDNGTGTSTTSLTTANGTVLTPTSTTGTVSTYSITPAIIAEYGNLNTMFDNSEQMTFTRTYQVLSCDNASAYRASWGCPAACMLTATLPQQTNIANGVPNLSTSFSVVTQAGTCTNGVYTVTYTNTGTGGTAGSAFNLDLCLGTQTASASQENGVIQQGDMFDLQDFSIGGTTVTATWDNIRRGGVGEAHPYTVDLDQLNGDPDGAGGLADLDGDGQFDDLPVGASVTLTFETAYQCSSNCGTNLGQNQLGTKALFTDQCSVQRQSPLSFGNTFTNFPIGEPSEVGPTDVNDGVPFFLEICDDHIIAGLDCDENRLDLVITLPPGVSYSGGASFQSSAITPQINGNILTLSGNRTRIHSCWSLELVYTCGVGAVLDIPYEVFYTCETGGCCTENWACNSFTTTSHCFCPIDQPGIANRSAELNRINFGWTGEDMTTLVDPLTLPVLNKKKALPCDTLEFEVTGLARGSYDNLSLSYSVDDLNGGASPLIFLENTGELEILDVSTNTLYTCNTSNPTTQRTGIVTNYGWDFSAAFTNCLPAGFILEDDDEVKFNGLFVVSDVNSAFTTTSTQLPNSNAYFFNLNALGEEEFCDNYGTQMYLSTVEQTITRGAQTNVGCQSYTVTENFRFWTGTNEDLFPNEFRPWARLDALEIVINTGDVYDPSALSTLQAFGGAGTYPSGGSILYTLPAPTINGNTLRWENDGTWPVADFQRIREAYTFRAGLSTSCASVTSNLTVVEEYTDRFYLSEGSSCQAPLTAQRDYAVSNSGIADISITNLTGLVQATSSVESWDVSINNISTASAPYPWIAIENNPNIAVQQVIDLATNLPVPAINYANGTWYQVGGSSGTAISSGNSSQYRIEYTTTSCETLNLTVLAGWDCSTYPSDPISYACDADQVILSTVGLPAEVQIQLISQPTPPFSLCSTLDYEVLLNSAQSADLDNPVLALILRPGLQLNGSITALYPNDATGTVEMVNFTTNGDTVFVDLESHSAIGSDGIPGTVNALNAAERQVSVSLSLITDCEFSSGGRLRVLGFGDSPCGDPANNNGVRVVSGNIVVQGAEPQYLANFSFDAGITPLTSCATLTADIEMTLINLLSDMTSDQDTLLITLDSGLEYEPNSFTNTDGLALINTSTNASGQTVLKIAMPSTPIDLSGGAVDIMMSFMFNATADSGCDITKEISAELSNSVTGLACASEPGGVCGDTKIILGSAETEILLLKPRVAFGATTSACFSSETEVTVTGTLEVSEQDIVTGNDLVVEFFCADAAGNPMGAAIGSYTQNGPITAGSSVPFTSTFAFACTPENGVVARIGANNCFCSEVITLFPVGELVTAEAGENQTLCSTAEVDLTTIGASITPIVAGFVGTWTSSGNGTFDDAAGIYGVATSYTFGSEDIAAGQVTLTLVTDDPANPPLSNPACEAASDQVILTILKVDCGTFPWDGQ